MTIYFKRIVFILLLVVALFFPLSGFSAGIVHAQDLSPNSIKAVTLDPADYLDKDISAKKLAEELIERFSENNINLVYVNAYNVEYGAYYKTSYPLNTQNELGSQDFLGHFIKASHRKGIKVIAAFYNHQHRGAWEANPDWREKRRDGSDYSPPKVDIVYFLSPSHPQFKNWWQGLIKDILTNYPSLDGIELREPVINWWGVTADYNPYFTKSFKQNYPQAKTGGREWRLFRAKVLTSFLEETISLIKASGKEVHLTTVASSLSNGNLASSDYLRDETGFDLNALLDSPYRPNVLKVEFIWQQWAVTYGYVTFTPNWTKEAVKQALVQVNGRVPVVTHLELTDFGNHIVNVDEFFRTMKAALGGGALGMDFYSAKLADNKGAWEVIKTVYSSGMAEGTGKLVDELVKKSFKTSPRALLLYDNPSLSTTDLNRIKILSLANLLGHFNLNWEVVPVEKYSASYLNEFDYVFYEGEISNNVSARLLADLSSYKGKVIWIGDNLWQLTEAYPQTLKGFLPVKKDSAIRFNRIAYKGKSLQDEGKIYSLEVTNPSLIKIKANVHTQEGEKPYVVQEENFWYIAGSIFPSTEKLQSGYLVFADLLHDILDERHKENRQAMLRIDGVNPLTPPFKLERIADLLYREKVPFQVALTPFYVDSKKGSRMSLSDKPELVKAVLYIQSRGGNVVLNGKIGSKGEFWNLDSEDSIRKRVEEALEELWRNGIYPLAWKTPDNAALGLDYALFNDYFGTFIEKRSLGNFFDSDSKQFFSYTQVFPYEIKSDIYGGRILPENIDSQIDKTIEDTKSLLVVRDSFATVSISHKISLGEIKEYVRKIKSLNYSFADLKKFSTYIKTNDTVVLSGREKLNVVLQSGQYLNEFLLDEDGEIKGNKYTRYSHYSRINRNVRISSDGIYVARIAESSELTLRYRLNHYWVNAEESVRSIGFFISWSISVLSSVVTFCLITFYLATKIKREAL